MPDCCAAANCKPSTDQSNVSFFRFPLDPDRCKQWIGNCRRPDLESKTPAFLHRNYKLCSKHFETSMICQQSALKSVLKEDAVPTLFDFTTNEEMAQNSSRKRTREKTEEETVVTKKTKGTTDDSKLSEITAEAEVNVESDPVENIETQNHPVHDESEKEDPAISKAKETLKDYFKETLALTGFSICNNPTLNTTKTLGKDPAGPLSINAICAEKIDRREVLTLGEDVMREEIRNGLRLARFFSILLEDKINTEGKDQIPVFVRSMTGVGFPQKHLMGFLPCDIDSDNLFLMLISEIRNKWGLRMEHCRGFTYLSTGSMSLKLKELACRMLRDFPQVVLAPSDPYAFNVWLIRSIPILSIQEVVGTVEEVAAVIRQSETLAKKLEAKITASYGHIKGEVDRVKDACHNHWEYGTDAFQTMLEILEPVLNSIGEMCTSALSDVDAETVEALLKLKEKLKNFNFIITLVVLKSTLCCVSILNPSLRGIISVSSTLQYTISNALKLLTKHMQEIAIFHRKWFSDAVCRAKKLGVPVSLPVDLVTNGEDAEKAQSSLEDYYREALSKLVLQYLVDEVKRVLGPEMIRILRWLSLVPSYMADHNFSIRKDKVADANLNNLARPDSFYDELGCWEVKWRHASKRRILPTNVYATLKIPDIGFYPNIQSLLRVLGTIPCIRAEADVYGQYEMVLDRYRSYMKEVPAEKRLCNMAFVYVNQDVHFSIEEMVEAYVKKYPEILEQLHEDEVMEVQPSVPETSANDTTKEDMEEPREMTLNMETEIQKLPECAETDKEALKSALQAAVTAAYCRQSRQSHGDQDQEVEYVTKSEINEVLKVCEDVVRERILSEVGNAFFSIFIDRVVKLGETDYLPMFLRFVDSFDVMRLELMGFVEVTLDTEAMCERLFDVITKEWHLDLSYCRGQAYLGSGEVSYKLKAFACKIQEKYPLAICTHCSCYSFNTWWSRSVPVATIVRAIDTLEEIVSFFRSTPTLEKQLDEVLAIGLRESYEKIHELQGKFCSSWLEKHDSYEIFSQILEPLAVCLENISNGTPQKWSLAVSNRANRLLQFIRDFEFIVAMVTLKNASSFTRELSAALQKDHFSAASQLCQISGIVATLNRVKTNIKVFHQNWFDEACAFAQNMGVQVKLPDSVTVPRDSILKPSTYYKDTTSVPLVDHLINMVKDYFSDDHKEALNLLSLVPSSVTMSYVFETLKSKPPLYVGDLPDPDNFFTELSCWKVKWKTKVVSLTIPETIFQTLRLPLMQYFVNINTLLKIMCVLPSTALEYCGEVKRHTMYQDYLKNTSRKDRSPCLAMLQVGTDFNRDLDRMVAQCLRVTPKTLEGICLDKESKTLVRTAEIKIEDDSQEDGAEDRETLQGKDSRIQVMNSQMAIKGIIQEATECIETQQQSENTVEVVTEEQNIKLDVEKQTLDENCHSDEPANNIQNIVKVFKQAAMVARRNCSLIDLSKQEQDDVVQKLSSCHWVQEDGKLFSEGEMLQNIVKAIRETILTEVQDSPFFSIIIDRAISVGEAKFLPVFVRYVNDCIPKVELIGFLPFDESSDVNLQAKALSATLEDEWGLQMGCCRGQSIMCMGTGSQSLRKMALDFLESYPLAVSTPSESCGLAYWLSLSLQNASITKVLDIAEDLLQFFDQSPRLESELAKTMDGLLNTPREALAEIPETCLSRWKKREDFFDILVDMLEGALNCLDLVTTNPSGSWSSSMSLHALTLSTTIRQADFVIPLVILKNACAPLRNCSTVFRCGNPADIICELEKIVPIIDTLSKMLENASAVHSTWFEEAVDLATKVTGLLSYPESVSGYKSPEVFYKETVSLPVLNSLIEEMKFNFSENHLKALKVLSLLPTCNPLPVLPESTDKLHTIYMSDLPEPETAEEDINTWATLWREKYQDVSPPTSISETLLHNEAKNLPNVATLLKLVAVLPSISMECDLMKTTLNSLRTLLKDGFFSRGSKSDAVMLLMHRQTLQSLDEVIEKCMESDPKSHQFLAQVKARANHLRMESEVIAMASQEITVDTSGSNYQQVAKDAVIEVNTATSEEISMETNGSTCIELAKETSVITPEGSEKPTTALQVIHACSSLMISASLQPTESIQDAIKQYTAVEQDRTGELMAVQNVNDGSEVLDQCGIGLTVTEDQSASNQLMAMGHDRIELSEIEPQVRTGQLVSVGQNETDQPMEVDESGNEQFVAPDQVGTDQPAISEQIVPDSFMEAGQVKTDQSLVEGQDEGCHTVTGLAREGGTGLLGSGDHNASVELSAVGHGVNEQVVSGYQSESDQVMEVDQSGDYQSVAADQGGTDQPASEQSVAELLAVGQVETGQSVLEGQDEVCQRVTRLGDEGKLVTGDQLLSDQLMAVDGSKKDQSILAEKCGTGQSGDTGDKSVADQFMAVGQVETEHSVVAGQVEASQTETANEDETSRLVSEDKNEFEQLMFDTTNDQCVTADQIVTDQFMTVGQDNTVYSMVERETETDQTETDLANVGAVDKLVSGDQGGSDPLIVVDSGNVQSVTVNQNGTGQSVTGNQSIADQFIAVGQVETDNSIVEHQEKAGLTEMGLANEGGTALLISEEQGGSDQLMVVDSGNNHSADQNRIGQSVTGDQFVAVQFMAVEVETNHTIVESQEKADPTEMGLANECRTGQLVSGDQSRSEQIMMVDSGSDQSITADQNRIGQSRTGEQNFADLFVAVETDRSLVRGHENVGQTEMGLAEEGGTGHSASGDQSGSEQLMVVDSGNYQCVTADQNKIDQSVADLFVAVEVESERSIVKGQENSGQTEIGLANVGGTGQLVSGGQSGSEQLMVVESGNDQSGTRQSVIDQHIALPFMAVEVDTDQSIVEGQNEAGQTEIRLANESASHLVSDYQIGSYQLMVVDDSENDQSVTAEQNVTGQLVTGDQSVPDQFVAVGQVETDQFIVEGQNEAGQTETEVANRGGTGQLVSDNQCGSDQLMVVDESGNDQSVRDQVTTHQPTVEGLGGAGQIISWNQSVTDQPMADECCENDQTVVKARVGTSLSNTYNQSVPDQFVSLSQDGTDQIVPGNLSGIDQSKAEDQSRPDQPQLAAKHGTEPFSLPAPNETASVHADPDLPSITDHSTPASHDITDQSLAHNIIDHSSAPEIEGTDQSKSTVQDGANKVSTLDGTGPAQRVLTLYDTAAREELLKELCGIKYFTIVTEEELEIDGQAYIPVGIHYLDKQDDQCENILAFIPLVKNITSFVDTLTFVLSEKWGLNFAFCRGQTLARPSALVSQMRQASALLSQRLSHAFGVLNPLTLQTLTASASSIREIMHSFECLEQLLRWFSDDVQRRVRLEEAVVHLFQQDEKANELKAKLSNNQWAMSHEILEIFTDILEAIILCLNEMKGDHNNEANAKQAQSFLSTIQNFDFILTIVIMKNILSLTKNLCQSLQGNSYDVYQAVNSQPDILSSLSELKNRIETHHQIWFQEAFALASKLQATMHLSLQLPVNVHYREDISKRTVEHCIAEVEGLSQDILSALRCLLVVPYVMSKVEGCCKDIEFFKVFQEDLPDPGSLQAELQRWWDRWQGPIASHQHLPDTIIGTLKTSDIMSFPNISTILRLLAVLSCSNMQGSFRQGKITSELYPL